MNKKEITFFLVFFIIFLTLAFSGCIRDQDNENEGDNVELDVYDLGKEIFAQKSRGEPNTTKIVVTDYKFANKIDTDEETIEPRDGEQFLLVHIETQVLIESEEIKLEINNKEFSGRDSGNQTFKTEKNQSNLIDYIAMVRNPSPIGLYPGAEVHGWVIFSVEKDIDLSNTYIKLEPDVVGNNTFRWKLE